MFKLKILATITLLGLSAATFAMQAKESGAAKADPVNTPTTVFKAKESSPPPTTVNNFGTVDPKDPSSGKPSIPCTGVDACNELIAKCAEDGGHMAVTSHDHRTGAPNGGYCRKWM